MNIVKSSSRIIILFYVLMALPLSAADGDISKLKQRLLSMFPSDTAFTISKTPVPGLFQVDFDDSFVYITADGQYAVKGDIINMLTNANLTDLKRADGRIKTMQAITNKETITYPSKNKTTTMTVFTDIDCSYCRKLHSDMGGYNDRGIEVHYVFYPRAGLGSNSHQKATSVWCADDQRKALDMVKSGRRIDKLECDTPILKHVEVANKLGVNSTPTLMFEDGTMLPGYIPPARLAAILKQRKIIK